MKRDRIGSGALWVHVINEGISTRGTSMQKSPPCLHICWLSRRVCVTMVRLMVMDKQSSLLLMLMALLQYVVCGSCTSTCGKFNIVVRLEPNQISWPMDLLTDERVEMMGKDMRNSRKYKRQRHNSFLRSMGWICSVRIHAFTTIVQLWSPKRGSQL